MARVIATVEPPGRGKGAGERGTGPIVFGTQFAQHSTRRLGTNFAQSSCAALTTVRLTGDGGQGGPLEAEDHGQRPDRAEVF